MILVRLFIAVILLVISSQSSALFMPAGFNVDNDATIELSDSDC